MRFFVGSCDAQRSARPVRSPWRFSPCGRFVALAYCRSAPPSTRSVLSHDAAMPITSHFAHHTLELMPLAVDGVVRSEIFFMRTFLQTKWLVYQLPSPARRPEHHASDGRKRLGSHLPSSMGSRRIQFPQKFNAPRH